MNKTDLANRIADAHEISKTKAREIVDDVFDQITTALHSGERVSLDKFGNFKLNERAARTGRNPQTGKEIQIAASRGAGFSAAKALKDRLNAK